MPILSLDHVQLAMPPGREDEARAFYEKALQIPEAPKPPHLAKRGGCCFERGSLKIHLGVELDFRPAKKAHPAFIVGDLAGLSATLASAGFPVRPEEPLDATRAFTSMIHSGTALNSWSRMVARRNEDAAQAAQYVTGRVSKTAATLSMIRMVCSEVR
jgi:hypothetical protein